MRRPGTLLLTLTLIWGCSFLFIKVADEGLGALQVAGVRIVLGAGTLATIMRVRREPWPRDPRLWAQLAFLGLVSNAVPFSLLAWGEQRIDSSLAGVFNATTPLWTALVAAPLLASDRLTRMRAVGLLLGFAGVVLVFAPWSASGGSIAGDLACVGAGACYGVGFVHTRRRVQGRASGLALASGQLTCAAVEMAIVVAVADRSGPQLTGRLVGSVLTLGILGTGFAYLLFYALIAEVGPTRASTVTYLVPLVAVTLGVTALHEPLSATTLIGAAVLLLGVAATSGLGSRLSAQRRPRVPGHNRAEMAGIGPPTV